MKRILAILFCLVMCLGMLFACGDESESTSTTSSTSDTTGSTGGISNGGTDNNTEERPFNYDMEEYITLPNFRDFVAKVELDKIQQHIDAQIMNKAVKSKRLVCVNGDVVNVTYTGYRINEDGTADYDDIFDSGDSLGVYLGSRLAIADFEDNIVGMSVGEDKEFLVTYPQDYFDESVAGKTICFVVILNEIYDAPIYDNDFVYALTQEYTSTVDYEDSLKGSLVLSLVYDYLLENSQIIKYPQKEYDELANELLNIEGNFEAQYGMTLDEYIMQNYNKTREEYIKSELKTKMIYHAVAQAENVVVTTQMISSEKTSLINYYWQYYVGLGYDESRAMQSAKDIVADLGENYLYTNVLFAQVESLLTKAVAVNETPVTYKSITQILAERENIKTGNDIGDLCPSFDAEIFDENGAWGTTIDPTKNVGKITVINFWGTWCGPCKSELPDFDRIATDFADDLTIYAIHSSYGYEDASSYVEKNFASSKIVFLKDYLIDEGDEYSGDVIYELLGGEGYYPYTLILDQDGTVVYKHTGTMSYNELAAVIDGLLVTEE